MDPPAQAFHSSRYFELFDFWVSSMLFWVSGQNSKTFVFLDFGSTFKNPFLRVLTPRSFTALLFYFWVLRHSPSTFALVVCFLHFDVFLLFAFPRSFALFGKKRGLRRDGLCFYCFRIFPLLPLGSHSSDQSFVLFDLTGFRMQLSKLKWNCVKVWMKSSDFHPDSLKVTRFYSHVHTISCKCIQRLFEIGSIRVKQMTGHLHDWTHSDLYEVSFSNTSECFSPLPTIDAGRPSIYGVSYPVISRPVKIFAEMLVKPKFWLE